MSYSIPLPKELKKLLNDANKEITYGTKKPRYCGVCGYPIHKGKSKLIKSKNRHTANVTIHKFRKDCKDPKERADYIKRANRTNREITEDNLKKALEKGIINQQEYDNKLQRAIEDDIDFDIWYRQGIAFKVEERS